MLGKLYEFCKLILPFGSRLASSPMRAVEQESNALAVPPGTHTSRKKICMLAYTVYELDNRVRRYAEALTRRGDQVDIIALSGVHTRQDLQEINGVTVYQIQHRDYNETSKWTYAWRLLRFLAKSSSVLTRLHRRNRYNLVHVHNMPDFLVFAAWYPKWTGTKLILDIHDIMPELFANKFKSDLMQGYLSLLTTIERVSAAFSDHVIVSNHLWLEKLVDRSVVKEKCSVFVNHVDPAIFYRRARTRQDQRFIMVFPGSLQWHQGLDIAIEAFVELKGRIPNAEFHIYSGAGGDKRTELRDLSERLGVSSSVKLFQGVPLDQIPNVIVDADLGVVPKRADSFGNEAYSTKIMEFMSQGVPVVASRTKIDSFYFEEGIVHFFNSGDKHALAAAILDVSNDEELRKTLIKRGYEYAQANSWDHKKQEYLDLVDRLCATDIANPSPAPTATHILRNEIPGQKHFTSDADDSLFQDAVNGASFTPSTDEG